MLLLVGGTGNLGGRIARRLAAHDLPFRAIVRPSTDPGELTRTATAVVRGDLRDISSLQPAVEEIDTVIAGLVVALARGQAPASLPDFEARLQRGVKGREAFCAAAVPLGRWAQRQAAST